MTCAGVKVIIGAMEQWQDSEDVVCSGCLALMALLREESSESRGVQDSIEQVRAQDKDLNRNFAKILSKDTCHSIKRLSHNVVAHLF